MTNGSSCPVPSPAPQDQKSVVSRLIQARRIAVVGLSDDPSRPSHGVAGYLKAAGKEVIPVNPNYEAVLGLKCYSSLEDVPGAIDLVNVFRRPEFCPEIVRQAIAIGAKGVWLQSGIQSADCRRLALEAGIDYVEDRCLMVDHMRQGR